VTEYGTPATFSTTDSSTSEHDFSATNVSVDYGTTPDTASTDTSTSSGSAHGGG
jgi:hypothetical protein